MVAGGQAVLQAAQPGAMWGQGVAGPGEGGGEGQGGLQAQGLSL